MKPILTKQEINKHIKNVFSKESSAKEIKSAKKLAMSRNIKLGSLRKKFCKQCYSMFNTKNSEIRIKNGMKVILCRKCKYINRYKLK